MTSYSQAEVARHSTKNSLWVVNNGKVYDVTDFANRHPGGAEILLEHAAENVSEIMSSIDPHLHSSAAYQILEKYYIGDLRDGSTKKYSESGISLRSGRTVSSKSAPAHNINNNKAPPAPQPKYTEGTATLYKTQFAGESVYLQGRREEDDQVDWEKPVLWQVGKLGEKYDDWVHMPVEGHIRLFYRDWVEMFANTPWWIIPIVWTPITLTFLYLSILNLYNNTDVYHLGLHVTVAHVPVYFVFGMLIWSLIEYILHRWLFHLPPPPNSPFLITMHFILHGQHHKAPFDKDRLVFPPVPGFAFAVVFWLVFSSLFPKPVAQVLMAGAVVGYMCYDLTHYYLHHGTPFFAYFQRLKSYHVKHHFIDYKKGFGISSKLWDYPFGTLIPDNATVAQKSR